MIIIHRGHKLSQQQLDAILPVLRQQAQGKISKRKLNKAIDDALEAAGCPVPSEPEAMTSKH
jgi:hypothetical protein